MLYLCFLSVNMFIFWLLLSGFWDNGLLLAFGVFSSVLAAYFGLKLKQQNQFKPDLGFYLRFVTYLPWLAKQIWVANVDTTKRIWLPKKYPISPTIRKLKMSQTTPLGQMVYANSITITPGTVSMELEDDILTVHALVEDSADDLEAGEMDARVSALESNK